MTLIKREDAIEAVHEYFRARLAESDGEWNDELQEYVFSKEDKRLLEYNKGVNTALKALPSAEAESDDLIIKGAKGIKDGLYNITDGKLFQYKAKGGTVRTYPIVTIDYAPTPFTIKTTSAEAVTIHNDGTLEVKVPNAQKVGRVLVMDTDSHIGGGLFYPDDAEAEWIPFRDDLLIRGNAAEAVGEFFNKMDISLFGRTGVRLARNVLNSVPTVAPLKWIPLNKNGYEPLFEGDYLLCLDDGYIASVYFDGSDWELWADSGEPVAWMPLPMPYREDGEV